jgi:hemolysin activation/secretion protein
MKHKSFFITLLGVLISVPSAVSAADMSSEGDQALVRFTIDHYVVEGASLLSKAELDAAVAPYVGMNRDFSDVQRALEAVEAAYAEHGYSAVRVLLPEQELEMGTVHFRVVESHFGKVSVKDNHFVSEANALNAVPSVRAGNTPRTKLISRELRLANENAARKLNVVMKAGDRDDVLDADVFVTDSKPSIWGISADNSGTSETGDARVGFSYLNSNAFNADHVASIQYVTSPEYPDRVKVFGAGYKIPLYRLGGSLEFFGGYSNVNSIVGGLSNFQGGGSLFSARYNYYMERLGSFDPRLSFGLDWRDYKQIEQINPPPTVLYNEIAVLPVSAAYSVAGKFARSELNVNASLSVNLPNISNGKDDDFDAYDPSGTIMPDPRFSIVRYGADYSRLIGNDWQFRFALNGQWSNDVLVLGEQIRLGGAYGVRGFSEGSEGGDSGERLNLEGYTPDFGTGEIRARALVFYDAGQVTYSSNSVKTTIGSVGIGLRANYGDRISLRCDVATIEKAGTDPDQQAGDWRTHASLTAVF